MSTATGASNCVSLRRWVARIFQQSSEGTWPLVPPPDVLAQARIGGGEFIAVGDALWQDIQSATSLTGSESILEIGCGVGRIASAITRSPAFTGRYEGFDVSAPSIAWCRANISERYPNFSFRFSDVANSDYNPHGSIKASQFRFPYPDHQFDLVLAISVFTHLVVDSAATYLCEAARVLRPGGRLVATWFLVDPKQPLSPAAEAMFPFDHVDYRVADDRNPEAVIAYLTDPVTSLYARAGLNVISTQRGHWHEGQHRLPYQDTIVAATEIHSPPYHPPA